jgi:hypothetical protein
MFLWAGFDLESGGEPPHSILIAMRLERRRRVERAAKTGTVGSAPHMDEDLARRFRGGLTIWGLEVDRSYGSEFG